MSKYVFQLKFKSKEVEVCTDHESPFIEQYDGFVAIQDTGKINLFKMTDEKQPYLVWMEEQKSADKINFFCTDRGRGWAVKGDIIFHFESFTDQSEEWCRNVLQNSIMGVIWKDRRLRHAGRKGFTWTDDLSKCDDLMLDLELLNVV